MPKNYLTIPFETMVLLKYVHSHLCMLTCVCNRLLLLQVAKYMRVVSIRSTRVYQRERDRGKLFYNEHMLIKLNEAYE